MVASLLCDVRRDAKNTLHCSEVFGGLLTNMNELFSEQNTILGLTVNKVDFFVKFSVDSKTDKKGNKNGSDRSYSKYIDLWQFRRVQITHEETQTLYFFVL